MNREALSIVSWNILHGGGAVRTPRIGLALVEARPDIVVLTEFRAARGGQIRAQLADAGLEHQLTTHDAAACGHVAMHENGILIASRERIELVIDEDAPTTAPGRWLGVSHARERLRIFAVHVPDDTNRGKKSEFWQFLLRIARRHRAERCVLIGDWNTARRGPDSAGIATGCQSLMGTLTTLGFVDAWRAMNPEIRDATWGNGREGVRIDAAYLSPLLRDTLCEAEHVQAWRSAGLSDHAGVRVRLRLSASAPANSEARGLFSH